MSSAVDTGSQSSMGTTTEVTTVEAGVDTGMSEGMTAETVTATVDVSVANTESSDTSVVETSEQPTQTVAQNIKQQQQEAIKLHSQLEKLTASSTDSVAQQTNVSCSIASVSQQDIAC